MTQLKALLTWQLRCLHRVRTNHGIISKILDGYNNNLPVYKESRFLHMSAHNSYSVLVIDLYCLFGPANRSNKCSFQLIKKFVSELDSNVINKIEDCIHGQEENIAIIATLRNKEKAHVDPDHADTIRLNFDHIHVLNELVETACEILKLAGLGFIDKSKRFNVGLPRNVYVRSLERLVAKTTR